MSGVYKKAFWNTEKTRCIASCNTCTVWEIIGETGLETGEKREGNTER